MRMTVATISQYKELVMTKPDFHAISDVFVSAMSSLADISQACASSLDFISSCSTTLSSLASYF